MSAWVLGPGFQSKAHNGIFTGNLFRIPRRRTGYLLTMTDLAPPDLLIGTLQSSLAFWNSLPFNICFVGHALYATSAGAEFKDRWLLHLLVSWLPPAWCGPSCQILEGGVQLTAMCCLSNDCDCS